MRIILALQGCYYLISGLWPLVHMPSFLFVTGPKAELWLVEMVGLLAAATGTVLIVAARRGHTGVEFRLLGVATAAAFTWIDVRYFLGGRLNASYLLDAAAEVIFILLILGLSWYGHRAASSPD